MLGLGEQIGGDPLWVRAAVSDNENFARAGQQIHRDLAENLVLGFDNERIAGTEDFQNRSNPLGAVGERSDGLCTADFVNLGRAGKLKRVKQGWVNRAGFVGGRCDDDFRRARSGGERAGHDCSRNKRRGATGT